MICENCQKELIHHVNDYFIESLQIIVCKKCYKKYYKKK